MKILFTYLALAGTVLTAQSAHATTFYQSAPSSNLAFQALVNQAQLDDVIILRAGSHYVNNPSACRRARTG